MLTGRDLEDRSIVEHREIIDGFLTLGYARMYMGLTIMMAALVQMILAAILGRSRTPIRSELAGEAFFP